DELQVSIPDFETDKAITKRRLVSYLASVYDPCGLVLATTLQLKLAIHDVWADGLDWDDPIPDKTNRKVMKIIKDIEQLKTW
ncbi:hypothetical protein BLA29_015415, partial [Euroglyphus maynei]